MAEVGDEAILDAAIEPMSYSPEATSYFERFLGDPLAALVDPLVIGSDPGAHELMFTHCVRLGYENRVRDDVGLMSWSDELLGYQQWLDAGEPTTSASIRSAPFSTRNGTRS